MSDKEARHLPHSSRQETSRQDLNPSQHPLSSHQGAPRPCPPESNPPALRMFLLLAALQILAVAMAQNQGNKIIGGYRCSRNSQPWQAALLAGPCRSFLCGGSLLSDQWVITAAHCTHPVTPGDPWCAEESSRASCPGGWRTAPSLVTPASTPTCASTKPGSRRPYRADHSRCYRISPAPILPKTQGSWPPDPPPSDPQVQAPSILIVTPGSELPFPRALPSGVLSAPHNIPVIIQGAPETQIRSVKAKVLHWHHIPKKTIFKTLSVCKNQVNTTNKTLTILNSILHSFNSPSRYAHRGPMMPSQEPCSKVHGVPWGSAPSPSTVLAVAEGSAPALHCDPEQDCPSPSLLSESCEQGLRSSRTGRAKTYLVSWKTLWK
ncbi:kallikrein-14 isoform X2 [Physeter macrocephalus]|uniref:trypsin n=1 Tax=Physeter macrocephalus TaxID=9755 RepID=A0A9W2W8C6_PHYMC|nr:kallikrein-14 isoform X2 [Physeter catodon]